jgi:hypothetical protein
VCGYFRGFGPHYRAIRGPNEGVTDIAKRAQKIWLPIWCTTQSKTAVNRRTRWKAETFTATP